MTPQTFQECPADTGIARFQAVQVPMVQSVLHRSECELWRRIRWKCRFLFCQSTREVQITSEEHITREAHITGTNGSNITPSHARHITKKALPPDSHTIPGRKGVAFGKGLRYNRGYSRQTDNAWQKGEKYAKKACRVLVAGTAVERRGICDVGSDVKRVNFFKMRQRLTGYMEKRKRTPFQIQKHR